MWVFLYPNIYGYIKLVGANNSGWWDVGSDGALYSDTDGGWQQMNYVESNKKTNKTLGFNAERSNSVYGNSTTVQPSSVKTHYLIKY